jgi:hypothetical protein
MIFGTLKILEVWKSNYHKYNKAFINGKLPLFDFVI